jgi:hypothetical protein
MWLVCHRYPKTVHTQCRRPDASTAEYPHLTEFDYSCTIHIEHDFDLQFDQSGCRKSGVLSRGQSLRSFKYLYIYKITYIKKVERANSLLTPKND